MNKVITVVLVSLGFSAVFAEETSTCSRTLAAVQSEFSEVQTDSASADSKALFDAQSKLIQLNGSLSCLKAEGSTDADLESQINELAEVVQKKISGATQQPTLPELSAEEEAKKYAQEKMAQHTKEADGYRAEIKQQESDRIDNEKKLATAKAKQEGSLQQDQPKEIQAQQQVLSAGTPALKSVSPAVVDKWENEKHLAQDVSDRAVNFGKGAAEAARYVVQDGAKDAAQFGVTKYNEFKNSPSSSTSASETARNVYGFVKEAVTGGQAARDLITNSKQVGSDIYSGAVNLPKKAASDIYEGAKTLADGGCVGIDCAKAVGKYAGGVANLYGVGKAATSVGTSVFRAPAAAVSVAKEVTKEGTKDALVKRVVPGN